MSYTYSRTERLLNYKNIDEGESGEKYIPAYYDKPHNLNVSGTYNITRRLSLSANFVFSSGRPLTVPESAYIFNNIVVANFSERNAGRIPNYNRLDVSLILKGNLKKEKWYEGKWVLSVYNIYGKRNPFSVYFDTVGNGTLPQAYRLSILGSAFPSLSYFFKIKQKKG